MSDSSKNRRKNRDRLFRRLNSGTDRKARRHQRLEAGWIERGERGERERRDVEPVKDEGKAA